MTFDLLKCLWWELITDFPLTLTASLDVKDFWWVLIFNFNFFFFYLKGDIQLQQLAVSHPCQILFTLPDHILIVFEGTTLVNAFYDTLSWSSVATGGAEYNNSIDEEEEDDE